MACDEGDEAGESTNINSRRVRNRPDRSNGSRTCPANCSRYLEYRSQSLSRTVYVLVRAGTFVSRNPSTPVDVASILDAKCELQRCNAPTGADKKIIRSYDGILVGHVARYVNDVLNNYLSPFYYSRRAKCYSVTKISAITKCNQPVFAANYKLRARKG